MFNDCVRLPVHAPYRKNDYLMVEMSQELFRKLETGTRTDGRYHCTVKSSDVESYNYIDELLATEHPADLVSYDTHMISEGPWACKEQPIVCTIRDVKIKPAYDKSGKPTYKISCSTLEQFYRDPDLDDQVIRNIREQLVADIRNNGPDFFMQAYEGSQITPSKVRNYYKYETECVEDQMVPIRTILIPHKLTRSSSSPYMCSFVKAIPDSLRNHKIQCATKEYVLSVVDETSKADTNHIQFSLNMRTTLEY